MRIRKLHEIEILRDRVAPGCRGPARQSGCEYHAAESCEFYEIAPRMRCRHCVSRLVGWASTAKALSAILEGSVRYSTTPQKESGNKMAGRGVYACAP